MPLYMAIAFPPLVIFYASIAYGLIERTSPKAASVFGVLAFILLSGYASMYVGGATLVALLLVMLPLSLATVKWLGSVLMN